MTPGGTVRAISEGIASLVEQISSIGAGNVRVKDSVEMLDYISNIAPTDFQPCYRLKPVPTRKRAKLSKEGASLGQLIDELKIVDPGFIQIERVSELEDVNFEIQQYQRPVGYSAQTRLHAGRLCVPTLNDTGATCACMTEEQM